MQIDPLPLRLPASVSVMSVLGAVLADDLGEAAPFALINIDGGASTRTFSSDGVKYTLSSSQIETKENKPTKTDRHLLRLEGRYFDTELKQEVVAAASLITSIPRGGQFSPAGTKTYQIVAALLALCTVEPVAHPEVGSGSYTLRPVSPSLKRFLSGEG